MLRPQGLCVRGLACALLVCGGLSAAVSGGGRRTSPPPGSGAMQPATLLWHSSIKAAVEAAQKDSNPVMAVNDDRGGEDAVRILTTVQRLDGWPGVLKMSQGGPGGLAAVKVNPGEFSDDPDEKLLFAKAKKALRIFWLDHYGNLVLAQRRPQQSDDVIAVVANWKSTLASMERFCKDHNQRADRYLERGKLREAYQEYGIIAAFKGPEAERAKAGQQKVAERWGQLLQAAADAPAGSVSRAAIIKGLRKDTQNLDFAARLESAIEKLGLETQVAAAAKPAGAPEATPVPQEPKPPAAAPPVAAAAPAAKPAAAPPPEEPKMLSEVVAARPTVQELPREDAGLDASFLKGKKDAQLAEAEKLIQEGLGEYRKGTSDNMDRGAARNELLRSAHGKFEKAQNILCEAVAAKPDKDLDKLMERIGMLMYGCLKYQSL